MKKYRPGLLLEYANEHGIIYQHNSSFKQLTGQFVLAKFKVYQLFVTIDPIADTRYTYASMTISEKPQMTRWQRINATGTEVS